MQPKHHFLILLILFSSNGFAQVNSDENKNPKGTNAIYFEFLGPAGIGSFNYEHGFYLKKNRNRINGRLGLSYLEAPVIPIGLSIDFGKGKKFFQINTSHTFDTRSGSSNTAISNTSIGIAYVKRPIRGFYFHASFYYLIFDKPFAPSGGPINSMPWLGFGFGHSF